MEKRGRKQGTTGPSCSYLLLLTKQNALRLLSHKGFTDMKSIQEWGWLTAGVLALGLNGIYHDGGGAAWAHRCIERIASRIEVRTGPVLALAAGRAEWFLARTQSTAAQSEATSCRLQSAVASVQGRVVHAQDRAAHFEAMSAREQAAMARVEERMARMEADRARIEARMAERMRITPAIFKDGETSIECPRVRVHVPHVDVNVPTVRVEVPDVQVNVAGLGPA